MLVEFTKKFCESGIPPFTETEWAQCLLYMAQNFDLIRPPNNHQEVDEGEGEVGFRPRGVLLAEIQEYKLTLAVRDKENEMLKAENER